MVARASAKADELTAEELAVGGERLRALVRKYRPRFVAVLGISSYRVAFDRPKAVMGLQPETMGKTKLWVLPNPSGLNAHYLAGDLARLFRELREAIE